MVGLEEEEDDEDVADADDDKEEEMGVMCMEEGGALADGTDRRRV